MPYHVYSTDWRKSARGGAQIGTTKRGIGPAYADKAARSGIRMGDLLPAGYLADRLALALPRVNRDGQRSSAARSSTCTALLARRWAGATRWTAHRRHRAVVQDASAAGQEILLEGQLGVMRDLDWGTYPYVTSSNPIAGGGFSGAGLPPRAIERVIGVVKAYCTAVGAGPFPTELHDESRRPPARGRRRVRRDDRPAQALRLARRRGAAVRRLAQRVHGAGRHQAGRAGRAARTEDLHGLSDRRREWRRTCPTPTTWPASTRSTRPGPAGRSRRDMPRRWEDLPQAAKAYLDRISELAGAPTPVHLVGPAPMIVLATSDDQTV